MYYLPSEKWIEVHHDFTNEGIQVTVTCERAGITLSSFQKWSDEDVQSQMIRQIEDEVIGGPINNEDLRLTHFSNRDLSNLIVTEVVSYLPLDLSVSHSTGNGVNQAQAREIAFEKLCDAIWDHKLSVLSKSSSNT